LISGVKKFLKEDTFTHPWRVYWYQDSRSFLWKMRLLIRGEFTKSGVLKFHMKDAFTIYGELTLIRSPKVSYGKFVYSSVESSLISGVQKFHMQDAFTHPWSVTVYFYLGLMSFYPLGRCGYLSLVSLFTHTEVYRSLLFFWERVCTYKPWGDC
jgi:hypothetical protein